MPSSPDQPNIESSSLYNPDLAPTPSHRRTWGTYNYTALWVAMAINISTYLMGSSLIQGGMNWKQALFTILLGTAIVLVPMLLNSHPGARYGIPFPVLVRASFGVLGANIPAVIRGLVACGWFGIQTWIGGQAINTLIVTLWLPWSEFSYGVGVCFMAFWFLNLAVIVKGMDYIRYLQGISAPTLLAVSFLLLGWAYSKAGGFGPMLSTPSRFTNFSDLLTFMIPALNGVVGFAGTMALNISDFTRFARSQREQLTGQIAGLPTTLTLYAFISIAVTSATVVIYGAVIWDPIEVLSRFDSPTAIVISLLGIILATLNVNIAANLVAPANDFSNLWPRVISFKIGGTIACLIGLGVMPWKLLESYETFIIWWLGGYAALMGPVAGVMICDYHVIRKRRLQVEDLFRRGGVYEYRGGLNWRAVVALCAGAVVALVGLLVPALRLLFSCSWFVSFGVGFLVYYALMRKSR